MNMTSLNTPAAISSFAEIRRMIGDFPGPDLAAATALLEREQQLTKPAGALGRLEELTLWLARWQGAAPPRLDHPRALVFAGNHGVASHGVSAYPAAVTAQMVQNFIRGGAAVNQLCRVYDCDLRVFELDLAHPTQDFTTAAAMSEAECVTAIVYGMIAIEPGLDVICLGEMGIGNTTAAAALCAGLFGGAATEWVGPGTGIRGEQLANKIRIVDRALAFHADRRGDPLAILAALGGRELAAIAGAIIAARFAHIPVILDGYATTAAAACLHQIDPHALDHCLVAHRSAEPGHQRLLETIGKVPLLTFDLRLGEATGAVLALGILRGALACHTGMATFSEAAVSGPA